LKQQWYWHKNKQVDQWNRVDSLEENSIYSHLAFDKCANNESFQYIVLGKLKVHLPKNETVFLFLTSHKNNYKWVKDLKIKPET
jgi:hypothetical protein